MKEVLLSKSEVLEKRITNVPILSPFADWDYYILRDSLNWSSESEEITVPVGFVSDLASIPRIFWSLLPRDGRYTGPAIIHDYLYWAQEVRREDADVVFKLGMRFLNVPEWKTQLIYVAVRIGGKLAWKNNSNLKIIGEKRILREIPLDPKMTWKEWKEKPNVFM